MKTKRVWLFKAEIVTICLCSLTKLQTAPLNGVQWLAGLYCELPYSVQLSRDMMMSDGHSRSPAPETWLMLQVLVLFWPVSVTHSYSNWGCRSVLDEMKSDDGGGAAHKHCQTHFWGICTVTLRQFPSSTRSVVVSRLCGEKIQSLWWKGSSGSY